MSGAATLERENPTASASVTMDAAVLARAMRAAAKVVEARNTIPILSNVRLTVDPILGKLEILTTDLDVEYRQRVPIIDGAALAITVDAGRLAALAGACAPGAQLRMALADKRLTVSSGRGRWVLPTLPVDDFPSVELSATHAITIEPASKLSRALARVTWSCENDTTRYYLAGPLLHPEIGKVRLAATNGHTAIALTMDESWPEDAPSLILGPKWCAIMIAQLADAGGAVTLGWDGSKIRAIIGDLILTGKVIDGSFPDYRRVMPAPVRTPILVSPEALSAAVRRVKLLGNEKTRSVKFVAEDGCIRLSHTSIDCGTATEDVPADCSVARETGFNAAYLMSMIDAIGGDTIEIHHADPGAPALFRRTVNDGVIGVVMPMRV